MFSANTRGIAKIFSMLGLNRIVYSSLILALFVSGLAPARADITVFNDDFSDSAATEAGWTQGRRNSEDDAFFYVDEVNDVLLSDTTIPRVEENPVIAFANRQGCGAIQSGEFEGITLYTKTNAAMSFRVRWRETPPLGTTGGIVGFMLADPTHPSEFPAVVIGLSRFDEFTPVVFTLLAFKGFLETRDIATDSITIDTVGLPEDFDFLQWHTITLTLVGSTVSASLDGGAGSGGYDLSGPIPLIEFSDGSIGELYQGAAGIAAGLADKIVEFDDFMFTGDELCIDNTPTGTDVEATLLQGVTITFEDVTTEGATSMVRDDNPPTDSLSPANFSILGEYYDISTTAEFTGSFTLEIPYNDMGMTVEEEEALAVLHFNETTMEWDDVTLRPVDTVNNIVSAQASDFSVFAVAQLELLCDVLFVGEATTTFIDDVETSLGVMVTTTSDFDIMSLDEFEVIIFTHDSAGLFSTDTTTTQRLNEFVSSGGGLLVEVGGDETKLDYGWVPHAGITAAFIDPADAEFVTIVEGAHEIVADVSDAGLDSWVQSIHGDFLTTGGLTTILSNTNTGNAVMLAGELGSGRVIYSNLDATNDSHAGDGIDQVLLLANSIEFLCGECITPGDRDNPSPANRETNVKLDPILMWDLDGLTTGDCADSFDVFFGRNPEFLQIKCEDTTDTFCDPGPLEPATTYYWRVDGTNCCSLSTGALWEFTTQDFCTTFTMPQVGGIIPGEQVTVPITAVIDPDKDLFGITDLVIEYDPSVLSIPAGDTSRVSTGGLISGFFMIVNVDTPGEIRIAASGTEAVVGSGTAFEITFDAVGGRGDCTDLDMTNVRVEDSSLERFCGVLVDGLICLQNEFYVEGSMRYFGSSNAPVDQTHLVIEVTYPNGQNTLHDMNDSNGNYSLTLPGGFNYQVIPLRFAQSGDQMAITAGDASLLLQHLVGLTTLSANQILAADTNCDGVLTAGDAGQILQLLVGKISLPFPGCDIGWLFVPSSRSYNPLSGDHTNQNFKGILTGDVSGNWSPPSP